MSELLAATHGTGNGWMYHDKPRYDDGDEVPAQYCCQFCPEHIGFFDLCRECGLKCFLNGGIE